MGFLSQSEAEALTDEIHQALQQITNKYGLVLEPLKAQINLDHLTLQMAISSLEQGLDRHARQFLQDAYLHHLPSDWLFLDAHTQSGQYRILGLHPQRYRYPIHILSLTNNHTIFMSGDQVRTLWTDAELKSNVTLRTSPN